MSFMSRKNVLILCVLFVVVVAALFGFSSCETGSYVYGTVYITDTFNGNVFTYDPDSLAASDALYSIGQGAGDSIYFFNDIGYVAVGSTGFNSPGVYYFDPNAVNPTFSRIGNAISAGSIAFYSNTKAYVTDRSKNFSTFEIISSGVYIFDPSNPAAGLSASPISGTDSIGPDGQYLQEIVVGTDGLVYVVDFDNTEVLVINPDSDTVIDPPYDVSTAGTSGLLAMKDSVSGDDLIYVASNGNFIENGVVDVINTTQGTISQVVTTVGGTAGIAATRLAYHAASNTFYASGWSNIYTWKPSGSPPYDAVEMKNSSDAPFAGSMLVDGDLLFVATTDWSTYNDLVVFNAQTAEEMDYSPVSIGTPGSDAISGIASYK